jgi:hypothetical protein
MAGVEAIPPLRRNAIMTECRNCTNEAMARGLCDVCEGELSTTLTLVKPLRSTKYNRYDFGIAVCHNATRLMRMTGWRAELQYWYEAGGNDVAWNGRRYVMVGHRVALGVG